LVILFDPGDQSGTAIGCLASDCRIAKAIGLSEAAPPAPPPVVSGCAADPTLPGCPEFCRQNPTHADCVIDPVEPLDRLCRIRPWLPQCRRSLTDRRPWDQWLTSSRIAPRKPWSR